MIRPRTRQLSAALAAVAFLGVGVAQTAHRVTEVHVVCAAHGAVEHTAHGQAQQPHDLQPGVRADLADEHSDECSLLSTEPSSSVAAVASIAAASPHVTAPLPAPAPAQPDRATNVLARAPKTSPPCS